MPISLTPHYTYSDLTIVPAIKSQISSRTECIPTYNDGMLPIWAAPMTPIIDSYNSNYFNRCGIRTIIPRSKDLRKQMTSISNKEWTALSLSQFKELFVDSYTFPEEANICIDIANGHMVQLYDAINEAFRKYDYKNLNLMVGNIANPDTYRWICENFSDKIKYVRVGIGSGSGCLTASNTGVHFPMASLIDECCQIKGEFDKTPAIIADGGIRGYADVIKALALGADYVMIGGLFAEIFESAGQIGQTEHLTMQGDLYRYQLDDKTVSFFTSISAPVESIKRQIIEREHLVRKFYGMSTKYAQAIINGEESKTSEGKMFEVEIKYTLQQWVENMTDYLKSAMSYCDARNLSEFIGEQGLVINSPGAISAVNK